MVGGEKGGAGAERAAAAAAEGAKPGTNRSFRQAKFWTEEREGRKEVRCPGEGAGQA